MLMYVVSGDKWSTRKKKTEKDVKVSDGNLNITLQNISCKLGGNVKCSALTQNAPQSEKGTEGRAQEQEEEQKVGGEQQQEQEG